jgi:hypothetical protein
MSRNHSKSKKPRECWRAPEHAKMTVDMERDYPKDDRGVRMKDKSRELQIDKRPAIMRPERKTYRPI